MTPTVAAEALAEMIEHLLRHAEAIAQNDEDLDDLIEALDIVQALCWEGVVLETIPEPTDMDATWKALAACVVERLAEVYSSPPHDLEQRVPGWREIAPPSPVEVWLIDRNFGERNALNPIFKRRNIMALENFLWFV
jgi:hypothetical protein